MEAVCLTEEGVCKSGKRFLHRQNKEERNKGDREKGHERRSRSIEDGVERGHLINGGGRNERSRRNRGNRRGRSLVDGRVDGDIHLIDGDRGQLLISEEKGLDRSGISNFDEEDSWVGPSDRGRDSVLRVDRKDVILGWSKGKIDSDQKVRVSGSLVVLFHDRDDSILSDQEKVGSEGEVLRGEVLRNSRGSSSPRVLILRPETNTLSVLLFTLPLKEESPRSLRFSCLMELTSRLEESLKRLP